METILQDLRFAFRSLRRSPGFTAVVVVVMALGIGVNAMVFSMVYGIMWRPWPLPEFSRVLTIEERNPKLGDNEMNVSYLNYVDLRDRAQSFESIGAFYDINALVVLDQDPERFYGCNISSSLLPSLGIQPVLGRNFTPDEEVRGQNWSTVLVSHRIWQSRYGGSPDVLGRTIRMNGLVRTIIGVLPPGFQWPEIQDFYIPLAPDPADTETREDHLAKVTARLKPGVSREQAAAEVATMYRQLQLEHPEHLKDIEAGVLGYQESWTEGPGPLMYIILIAVVFVLLIACANVANLMLARTAARRREISVRMALGASRGRVVRQLFTESLVLALFGAGVGVLLALWGNQLWIAAIPLEKPFYMDFTIDAPVLLYTAGISMLAAIVFGVTPAMHATDRRLSQSLREGGAQSGTARSGRRFRNSLIVAEVALSIVLLIGTGLMLRSFMKLSAQGDRLHTEQVLTAGLLLPVASFPNDSARRVTADMVMQRVRDLPGVRQASLTTLMPMGRNSQNNRLITESGAHTDKNRSLESNVARIYPGSFETLGWVLHRGRDFNDADEATTQPVAIVNEALAKSLWPGEDPLGKRIQVVADDRKLGWRVVVGLVQDIPINVDGGKHLRTAFVPHRQEPNQWLNLLVRAEGDPASLAQPLRSSMREVLPDLPLLDVRTFSEHTKFSFWVRRLFASMMLVFSVIALLIAAVGLYGVMAFAVTQRTQEIGIRMALGAERGSVLRMVLGDAMKLTVLGSGIGLVIAFAVTRFMATVLFDVSPTDPPTFAIVALILTTSAAIASLVPALRATRVDPMVALRSD